MPNSKKQKPSAKCQAQYNRTVKNTGKWRGQKPDTTKKSEDQVISYRHKSFHKICDHFFGGNDNKECMFCGISIYKVVKLKRWEFLKKIYNI